MSEDLDRLARAIEESSIEPLDAARRARIRSRVLSAAVMEPRPRSLREAGKLGTLAAAAVVLLAVGLGGAASASLPGDPAFALKMEAEHLQLLLTTDLYRRLDTTLERADRRLGELELLSHRDTSRLAAAADAYDQSLADVRDAVDAMASSEHADRPRALDEARSELDRHVAKLAEIHAFTDGDVGRALERARETDERVREVEHEDEGPDRRTTPTAEPTTGPLHSVTPAIGSVKPAATESPARTEPSETPDARETPTPARTAAPAKTLEPARTVSPTRSPEETRTPSPSPSRS